MRKNNLFRALLIGLIFISFILAKPIIAQDDDEEFNFDRAYQDYIFSLSEYEKLEDTYQLKRSEYLKFQTLSSKTEAENATREMLKKRDEVVITYLTALRTKVVETNGVTDKESKLNTIDQEVTWYKEHNNKLDEAFGLEDLVAKSNEVQTRYPDTLIISYNSLTELSIGKLIALRHPLSNLTNKTKERVEVIKGNGDKETEFIQRWVVYAENEITKSDEKVTSAREVISSIKPRDKQSKKRSIYLSAQNRLNESHKHLKEASRFLKEILLEIKTAD